MGWIIAADFLVDDQAQKKDLVILPKPSFCLVAIPGIEPGTSGL